jgi:hypothetical protein
VLLTDVDDGVLCDNTKLSGIRLNHFEFDGTHSAADKESISFSYWSIRLQEVRLEVNFEKVSSEPFDRVVER